MKSKLTKLAIFAATAAALGVAGDVRAMEASDADTTAPYNTSVSAAVNVDFRVQIPKFIFFQVGSAGLTIDELVFAPTVAQVEASTPVSVAGLNVTLRSNGGAVTITEGNSSGGTGLGTGVAADGYISYSTITAAVSGADTDLVPPALSDLGGNTSPIPVTSGRVTNKTAVWTYTYTPVGIPGAGDYGGSANGGRVTFTAATP